MTMQSDDTISVGCIVLPAPTAPLPQSAIEMPIVEIDNTPPRGDPRRFFQNFDKVGPGFDLESMAHRITDCHIVLADMADNVGDELLANVQQEICASLGTCNEVTRHVRTLLRVYAHMKRMKRLRDDFTQEQEVCRMLEPPSQGATTFVTEQPHFAGPDIKAETREDAEKVARFLGVKVLGVKDGEMADSQFPPYREKDADATI